MSNTDRITIVLLQLTQGPEGEMGGEGGSNQVSFKSIYAAEPCKCKACFRNDSQPKLYPLLLHPALKNRIIFSTFHMFYKINIVVENPFNIDTPLYITVPKIRSLSAAHTTIPITKKYPLGYTKYHNIYEIRISTSL